MTRSVLRYVKHRITQRPDIEVTFQAECQTCEWKARPSTDGTTVDVECMSHTGRTGRPGLRSTCTSFAMVTRVGIEAVSAR
ncbi:hypothetical protein FPZ41_21810 [Streptomyces sp. K1PN6]|uniref:DUF7848 domain-containing protein n=1 Tax=Streptomyces acidicola TaxID=2596892 RepID=A0A5N8WVH5_9ACTN|nr:hypothetical protein [Streptomyces acidicola]